MNGLAVLPYGEIRCWSLLGFKGLSFICFHQDNFYNLGPLCWWLDTIMNENFMRNLIFYYNLTHTIFQNEISNNLGQFDSKEAFPYTFYQRLSLTDFKLFLRLCALKRCDFVVLFVEKIFKNMLSILLWRLNNCLEASPLGMCSHVY